MQCDVSLLTRLSGRGTGGCCAVLGLVLLPVLLEDLGVGGIGRHVQYLCKGKKNEYEFFLHITVCLLDHRLLVVGTASQSRTKTGRELAVLINFCTCTPTTQYQYTALHRFVVGRTV
jgi:hypothetical protein